MCIENANRISEVKPFKRPEKDFMTTMLRHQLAIKQNKSENELINKSEYIRLKTNYITSKQHSSQCQILNQFY